MNRMLFLAVWVALTAVGCRLEGASDDIGLKCETSNDCDNNDHGCVPVDETVPTGTRVCMPPAAEWTCKGKFFGDGFCDCGCGFLDLDCNGDLTSAACHPGDGNHCAAGNPVATDNTKCQ